MIFILGMYNDEIFRGKTFSELLNDIYKNSEKKEKQISALIRELQPMIKNLGDATIVVPLIKEYMELAIKNDEHLIKMAAIVQRSMTRTTDTGDGGLTDEEKKQLLQSIQELEDDK